VKSRITSLDLGNQSLPPSGGIPLALLDLTGLTDLRLDTNQLTGSISSQLAELTGLHVLSLHDNQLTGTIPSQLAELTALTKLWLGRDLLTGTIPSELAKLTRVTDLELYSNQLTGAVPSLPFKQYTSNCCLYYERQTNNFTCPLPAGAAECKCNRRPGVACKDISTWAELNAAVAAVAGKTAALTLSPSFTMEGYVDHNAWSSTEDAAGKTTAPTHTWAGIIIDTAYTNVSIFGNGATFVGEKYVPGRNPRHPGRFFKVGEKAVLSMSNVTLRNGLIWPGPGAYGGAIYVASGGTFTVTSSTFSGNHVYSTSGTLGGAVYVASGGTFSATSTAFSGNQASGSKSAGGALFVDGGTVLIKNCSFVGPISNQHNDIFNNKGGNVTFACPDGEVGTPVQMQGTEITVIPPNELKCK
jgi:hypothetical protein